MLRDVSHSTHLTHTLLGSCASSWEKGDKPMSLRACTSHTLALRSRAGRRLDQPVHSEAGAHANAGGCSRGRPGAVPQVHALHYAA